LFKERRRASRRHCSNTLTGNDHVLMIACDATLNYFKSGELALYALRFLTRKGFTTDEVAFIQFADPTETGFEQRCAFIELVAVERHARFESKCVPSGEATRQHACGCTGLAGV